MTTALILDPALQSVGGHHYNAALRLRADLAALNIDSVFHISAAADAEVLEALDAFPTFQRSVYWRSAYSKEEFRRFVRFTRTDLKGALPCIGRQPQLVIMPCCDQVLALAFARQLPKWPFRSKISLILWLMFAPHYKRAIDDPSIKPLWEEYAASFAALRSSLGRGGNMIVCCETEGMATAYRQTLGLEVQVVAGPNLVAPGRGTRNAERPPRVLCIGYANEPKGYQWLPQAIRLVQDVEPGIRFLVHGIVDGADCAANRGVFDVLTRFPDVVVSNDVLSPTEYQNWMEEADLVLLPYDPLVYRTRGSGVFNEATRLGLPVIASQGCGFASEAFAAGRAQAIDPLTAEGIAVAVLRAAADIRRLRREARRKAQEMEKEKDPITRILCEGVHRLACFDAD